MGSRLSFPNRPPQPADGRGHDALEPEALRTLGVDLCRLGLTLIRLGLPDLADLARGSGRGRGAQQGAQRKPKRRAQHKRKRMA
jgi:hypothetical protein